jgi:hypothetical protein
MRRPSSAVLPGLNRRSGITGFGARRLSVALALLVGLSLAVGLQGTARAEGATVIRTPEETCFIETSPGVFEEFTCNNLDVYTPNDKIRTTAHGEFTPSGDGTADQYRDFPEGFPVCDATVAPSGKTRWTCHLDGV